MHNRIIQLSEEPLKREDWVVADAFCDNGFVGTVADYVVDVVNRKDDIKWFLSLLKPYGTVYDSADKSVLFSRYFKEKYFALRLNKVKELVDNMNGSDLINDMKVFELEGLINNKYGMYIYKDYWMSLDNFVRKLEEGVKYHVGAVLDYHF